MSLLGTGEKKMICCSADVRGKMMVAAAVIVFLVFTTGLTSARPVSVCPSWSDGRVPLLGLDGHASVDVALPGLAQANNELLECRVRPGMTISRSVVFRGSERWWFEVSLPPITLLEVDCNQRTIAGNVLVGELTVVCARCQHAFDLGSDASLNESNVSIAEYEHFGHRLDDDSSADPGQRSRRLRRSSPSSADLAGGGGVRRPRRKRTLAQALLASVAEGVVLMLLIALCTSKKKSRSSPKASSGELNEVASRPNESNAQAQDATATEEISTVPTPSSVEEQGNDAAARSPAATPETTEAAAGQESTLEQSPTSKREAGSTEKAGPEAKDASDTGVTAATPGEPAANQASASPAKVADNDSSTAAASPLRTSPQQTTADGAQDSTPLQREEVVSPSYECIRGQGQDGSIEESGDAVVHHTVVENADGYVYANVEGRSVSVSKRKEKKRDDGNDDDDDEDDPSYEAVIAPTATLPSPPPSHAGIDRGRSASQQSALSHQASKSASLQRSLPEPVGEPAFVVQSRKPSISVSASDIAAEQEDDPTYSCVDESNAEAGAGSSGQRSSDMYERVDEAFRSGMHQDEPYSRVFDDISETGVESPYSRVRENSQGSVGAANLSPSHGGSSLSSAQTDGVPDNDDSYDTVFDSRKSAKQKSPQKEAGLQRSPIPEEEPSSGNGGVAERKTSAGTHDIYARPEKTHHQPVVAHTEEGVYEKPPQLAPKQPGAEVLESAVVHYEAGKEDAPIEGIPVHDSGDLYAMPGKGTLGREVPPELEARGEESRVLLAPSLQAEELEDGGGGGEGGGGGYASVNDSEFDAVRQELQISGGGSAPTHRKASKGSLASVGSKPEDGDADGADPLYSAVKDTGVEEAKSTAEKQQQQSTRKGHGYSKVTNEILGPPKDPDAAVGDPGYQEVDAKLKEQLAKIRAEGAESPAASPSRNIARSRAQTTRLPDEPPPAIPSSQRPRASTMDSVRML
ncbi:uncharacterized protein LOC135818026 isoform X2 [Sycon ciliatum]|uniref:uncharacterized protein LOC135818026 isoform X2 n=1 Tax=Sycon ciliatum TaxID=27933 RepID=UPI0031F6E324